jgi:hypothetical protein
MLALSGLWRLESSYPQAGFNGNPSTVARDGVEPSTFRFSVGRSYQLSYLAVLHHAKPMAKRARVVYP